MTTDDNALKERIEQLVSMWAKGNDYERHLAWQLGRALDPEFREADISNYQWIRIERIIVAVEAMGKCEYGCSTEAIRLIKETK